MKQIKYCGAIYEISDEALALSNVLKSMCDNIGDGVIELDNSVIINDGYLKKIIDYCEYHKDDEESDFGESDDEDDFKEHPRSSKIESLFDEGLMYKSNICLHGDEIGKPLKYEELMKCANYLEIKGLLELCAKVFAQIIMKSKNLNETFRIECDFTPEKKAEVERNTAWVKSLSF